MRSQRAGTNFRPVGGMPPRLDAALRRTWAACPSARPGGAAQEFDRAARTRAEIAFCLDYATSPGFS